MKSQNIYFDLDDTLINTRDTILKRINLLLEKYPLGIDSTFVYKLLVNPRREHLLSGDKKMSRDFWSGYERLRKIITATPIPGAKETLEFLSSKGNKLGIITNNICSKTLEKLQYAGIDLSLFNRGIYSCLDNGCPKPSSKIISHLGLDSKDFTYVGEDVTDYDFARNSGADFYAVCTGEYRKEDFTKLGLSKDRIFPSIREVFQR